MYRYQENVLNQIIEKIRERLGERIDSVYVFGSRVRGDHDAWSDFDVLIVVKRRDPILESEIMDIFVHEELKTGFSFTPVIKNKESFDREKEYHTPFYESIKKEGILL